MKESLDGYVDWKGWTEDEFGRFDRPAARYYAWHVERAVGRRASLRVVELGFGNGAFLGFCRSQGWDVCAVETDARLRARAERAGIPSAASIGSLSRQVPFDLIALFDVLEHVGAADLVPFVRDLASNLAPNGAILIRVPNGDSPFGGRHQHGDMTHITTFGEFKLVQLAELAQLKLVALGEAPWSAQQTERRNLRALIRATTRYLINALFGFAYFGRSVDLAPNLVAVLRREP